MLRVLIADDEERICQLIIALGEWERLGLEVVGTASNGPDALEMVRTFSPDILITDIRMPGYDGLKLLMEAHRLVPDLEAIIISGYAQFDYAQTAIRFGVGEYLLKPINREALNRSLSNMAERCRDRKRKDTDIESLRKRSDDDVQLLRSKLIADLLAGTFTAADAGEVEHIYHFTAGSDALQLLLLKLDYDIDRFSEASLSILRDKVRGVMEPVLASYCTETLVDFTDARMICVMNYPRAEQKALRAKLRDGLNRLVAAKGLFGSVDFSLAVGALCTTFGELASSLPAALNLLSERLIEGTGRMLEGEAGRSGLLDMDFQAQYTQAASHAIEVMSEAEADAAADALSQAAAIPGARGWELVTLVRSAGVMFVNRLNAGENDGALADFNRRCTQCSVTADLFGCLKRLQRAQMARAEQKLRDRDTQPIRSAKLYIRKHFSEPITLEEVSAAAGFSVNYFSSLFKKETGESFTKYLTRVRMDEARSLLRTTGRPVAEVCHNVGYGDLKHFTRTFKAETGLTPGEFRKLYG